MNKFVYLSIAKITIFVNKKMVDSTDVFFWGEFLNRGGKTKCKLHKCF
jgi:hypothetical protein